MFLSPLTARYGLGAKYEMLKRREAGDPNPFIDHAGFLAYVDLKEQQFEAMFETQRRAVR